MCIFIILAADLSNARVAWHKSCHIKVFLHAWAMCVDIFFSRRYIYSLESKFDASCEWIVPARCARPPSAGCIYCICISPRGWGAGTYSTDADSGLQQGSIQPKSLIFSNFVLILFLCLLLRYETRGYRKFSYVIYLRILIVWCQFRLFASRAVILSDVNFKRISVYFSSMQQYS